MNGTGLGQIFFPATLFRLFVLLKTLLSPGRKINKLPQFRN
jgi:hypothetical protein